MPFDLSRVSRSYHPARGGRAPDALREAFGEAVEAYATTWMPGLPEPTGKLDGEYVGLSELCGLLWNCSDLFGQYLQDRLSDIDQWEPYRGNRTVGAAARWIKDRYRQGVAA